LNLARDIIPIAIGTKPTVAYGVQNPNLYEISPAAMKSAITNAKERTDRLRGMNTLKVNDQIKLHAREHKTGHHIAFPDIRNSRQRDMTE
jgi:hypothetical protein